MEGKQDGCTCYGFLASYPKGSAFGVFRRKGWGYTGGISDFHEGGGRPRRLRGYFRETEGRKQGKRKTGERVI